MPDASRHCKRPALELGARWPNEALRGHPTTGFGRRTPDDLERSVAAAKRSGTAQGQDQAGQPASLGPARRPAHSHAAVEAVPCGSRRHARDRDGRLPSTRRSIAVDWVPRPWSPVFDARPLRLSRLRRPSATSIRCARQRLFPARSGTLRFPGPHARALNSNAKHERADQARPHLWRPRLISRYAGMRRPIRPAAYLTGGPSASLSSAWPARVWRLTFSPRTSSLRTS